MKTFRHGGKIGDVIYSLPTIRELGGGILYLPERTPDACDNLYSSLKDLLLLQPYIHEVREYPSDLPYMELAPDIHIDYDLDLARLQPMKGVIHIVKRYMDTFGVDCPGWKEPWLHLEGDINDSWGDALNDYFRSELALDYALINYTGRHVHNDKMNITSKLDWRKVLNGVSNEVYFVGSKLEYRQFIIKYGYIRYFETANILQLAYLIKGAHSVYCNQSSVLALSQSLGKTYYLEPKPQKTNCLLYTQNENILQ
jgi:hypothetical protein